MSERARRDDADDRPSAPLDPARTPRAHEEEVEALVVRLAKWLPEQRPLGVFVHLNPLGVVEDHPFHAACEAATRIRGARTTQVASRYRELVAERRIRPDDLAAAKLRLTQRRHERLDPLPGAPLGTVLFSRVVVEMAGEVGPMVDRFLLRVLPPFLDLGSALWPMPHRERGLLETVRWLARTPLGVPEPCLRGLGRELGGDETALAVAVRCLAARGDPAGWSEIVREALFALPGYAGMIHRLEHHPAERPPGVPVSLVEYLAVRLAAEARVLTDVARRLFGRRAGLSSLAAHLASHSPDPAPPRWTEELAALQDAYEEDYVRTLIGALATAQGRPERPPRRAHAQLLSCIDDRNESLRRHVEEVAPDVATFGVAGFFGAAVLRRAPLDVDEVAHAPAPVTPERRVSERLDPADASGVRRARLVGGVLGALLGDDASRGVIRGALSSFASFVRTPRLAAEMLLPQAFVRGPRAVRTTLVLRRPDEPNGIDDAEAADIVERTLSSAGLRDGLAPWVLVVGHGSTSLNNLFSSGYQCGACGGQRGGLNARVFCALGNDPGVRRTLLSRGVAIPDETVFVAGEHDTALDVIDWYDVEVIPPSRHADFVALGRSLEIALERNLRERARRFADVPLEATAEEARWRVRRRSADFAETRPEYNHATNAACIIGRRALTEGVFLDRRAFLVSYDPLADDQDRRMLERILAAPLPVCAGISLEYFFSTIDPVRFGCGTKLPHNLQGLLGVSNGADGDLRPGLWTQTTEIHEPVRLVTVVDAEPEDVARVLVRLPGVRALADNDWIHLFALSPSGRGFFRWVDRRFEAYVARPHALYEVPSSLAACAHTRDAVAPCLIAPDRLGDRDSDGLEPP